MHEAGAFPGLWGGTPGMLQVFDVGEHGLLMNSTAFGQETIWLISMPGSSSLVPAPPPRRLATQARVLAVGVPILSA